MILKTMQGIVIKRTLETLKDLVKDLSISFTEQGMSLTCLDFAHISMQHFKLRAEGLEHYECPRDVTIGVDTGNFHRFLKHVSPRHELKLELDTSQGEPDIMVISIQAPGGAPPSRAEMTLLTVDDEPLHIEDADFDTTICMQSEAFRSVVTDMAGISEVMTVCSKDDGVVLFSCKGIAGSLEYKVEHEEDGENEDATKITQTGELREDFSMRHLANFTKATDLSTTVWLYLQMGNPFMIKYEIADLAELVFVLAPKVDESDEETMEE